MMRPVILALAVASAGLLVQTDGAAVQHHPQNFGTPQQDVVIPTMARTKRTNRLVIKTDLEEENDDYDSSVAEPSLFGRFMGSGHRLKGPQSLTAADYKFDSFTVQRRLDKFWDLNAQFGLELAPNQVYMQEVIPNRFVLTKGFQNIRDELAISFTKADHAASKKEFKDSIEECAADLSLPSVLSTCGFTECGDRMNTHTHLRTYKSTVARRFASLTTEGEPKPELFSPPGGGTDSGPILAHVTLSHAIDKTIKDKLYHGNEASFVLVNIDITTHCGHFDVPAGQEVELAGKVYKDVPVIYGLAQESVFRDPRAACWSIVGMLTNFDLRNLIHIRLRSDLGEKNYYYLRDTEVLADDGSPVNYLIASAIISIQGMRNTLSALGPGGELDERSVGHVTSQILMNNGRDGDGIMYCGRGTAFNGCLSYQGLGTDAKKYSAKMWLLADGRRRCQLLYDGKGAEEQPVQKSFYHQID